MIHDELHIIRYKQGIQLVEADYQGPEPLLHTIGSIKQLPFSFYFLDTQGATVTINEEGARVCGFGSVEESLGKSLRDVSSVESANKLILNCTEVINNHEVKIYDEEHIRQDDVNLHFLSIKSPWYDEQGEIIGVMGCSIVLGQHSLSESLTKITELGVFDANAITPKKNITAEDITVNNVHLTPREIQCLRLTVKGYTAKMIARQLDISYRTVEEYLLNVRIKMGASSKSELIQMTLDNFLTEQFA